MHVAVPLEVRLLTEALAAVGAPTGRAVAVCAEMCVEVGGAVEGLLTDGTYEGFDGRVRESMTRQVPRLTERSSTHLTPERLLSSVDPLATTLQLNMHIQKRIFFIAC